MNSFQEIRVSKARIGKLAVSAAIHYPKPLTIVRVAVDVQSQGDIFAAEVMVHGAMEAVSLGGLEILLVGNCSYITPRLERYPAFMRARVSVYDHHKINGLDELSDSGQILVTDKFQTVMRGKEDSSMVIGIDLVKAGAAQGLFSRGNTGVLMAKSAVKLGRVCKKPPIIVRYPTKVRGKYCFYSDGGANTEATIEEMVEAAIVAQAMAMMHGGDRRTVGVMNYASEEEKHTPETHALYLRFKQVFEEDFIGFVEGGDVFKGNVDVVVSNGFVGNVGLKMSTGGAKMLQDDFKELLGPLISLQVAAFRKRQLRAFRDRYENIGGSPIPLTGGVVEKGHGASTVRAVCYGIRDLRDLILMDLPGVMLGIKPRIKSLKPQAEVEVLP